MTWVLVGILAVGTAALKVIGPLLVGGRQAPAALVRVIDLLTPALLTALVVTSTLSSGRHLVLDARAAGVALGVALLLLRVPLLVALVLAAAALAGIRLLA